MSDEPTLASILHVRVVSGAGGGPDKTIARAAAYLDPARFDVASAYLYPSGDRGIQTLRDAHAAHGQMFFSIPECGPVDWASVRSLVRLCRSRRIDIWHSHDYKSDVLGLVVRRFCPMKLVTTVHGFTRETRRTRLYARINDWVLPRMDHVAAVSPKLVEHCALRGVNPDRLSYVPNGVEVDRLRRTRTTKQAKRSLGLHPQRITIGIVARLSVEKGVDRALRMFAQLRADGVRARMVVVGDGPKRAALMRQAKELGVSKSVHWAGWQKKTRRFYQAMDLFVLPSRTEGLPNAMLEAMAMGVPVAATQVGAAPAVLDAGRYGVLLADDDRSWAQAVAGLCRNRSARHRLAQMGRQQVQQAYSFEKRMQKMTAIYERVLGLPSAERVAAPARAESPLRTAA